MNIGLNIVIWRLFIVLIPEPLYTFHIMVHFVFTQPNTQFGSIQIQKRIWRLYVTFFFYFIILPHTYFLDVTHFWFYQMTMACYIKRKPKNNKVVVESGTKAFFCPSMIRACYYTRINNEPLVVNKMTLIPTLMQNITYTINIYSFGFSHLVLFQESWPFFWGHGRGCL